MLEDAYRGIRQAERELEIDELDAVDALEVHLLISSHCVFQVADAYTFGYLFERNLQADENREHLRR